MVKKLNELIGNICGGQIIQRITADPILGDVIVDPHRGTIVAKTISDGSIVDDNIVYNNYRELVDQKKYTKEGDIVLKMAPPYSAVLIDKQHENLLVSSFCSIIRDVSDMLDKDYLVAILNSKYCQDQLSSFALGSTMAIMSNGKLKEIDIPIPALSVQREIGAQFNKVIKSRKILNRIIELENEKLATIINNMEK